MPERVNAPLDVNPYKELGSIEAALEVERLDVNLFRSKSLFAPYLARGVFGGQVISQAIVSATKCVKPEYSLHSFHVGLLLVPLFGFGCLFKILQKCYFLLSASPSVPIIYLVERIREGRTYTTRSVKATQEGRVVFILVCSFQRPEPWQPSQQWTMPSVPSPDDLELDEDRWTRQANREDADPRLKKHLLNYAAERAGSAIRIKRLVEDIDSAHGVKTFMYWMQVRDVPKYGAPFQKCILSYMSDFRILVVGARILGLKPAWNEGPDSVGMTSSLDHAIYFYDDNFDCGDWLLYVIESPRAGSGRAIMHGRVFTRAGKLVAVTTQEGVIRANIRRPPETKL